MEEFKLNWSEQCHWCDYLGNPITQVPRSKGLKEGICPQCSQAVSVPKNKKPENTCPKCKTKISTEGWFENLYRDVKSNHARKFGLFASCSRAAGWGQKPWELLMWDVEGRAGFCMDFGAMLYKQYGEEYKKYKNTVDGPLKEYMERYSNWGTQGHAIIHKAMTDQECQRSEVMDKVLGQIKDWEASKGVKEVNREASFINTKIGIGGTIDTDCREPNFISDYKFKFSRDAFEKLCKKQQADYVINQLALYGMIRPIKPDEYFIVPILMEMKDGVAVEGQVEYIPLTEEDVAEGEFRVLKHIDSLYASLKYDPRIMYKEGQCWSWEEICKGTRNA